LSKPKENSLAGAGYLAWIFDTKSWSAAELEKARKRHREGAGGLDVVRMITGHTDALLSAVFDRVCAEASLLPGASGWALAAVGGYGRGELNPYSDIDIMFLGRKLSGEKDKEFATRALHAIWDLGVNIGYSVRTPDECCVMVKTDYTILTALLETRLICGDPEVFKEFETRMKFIASPKSSEAYIREKLQERVRRHKKHGDSVYLREPNLKEGAGGLRDIHTALWISRIKNGTGSLEELIKHEILSEKDARRLLSGRDYLLRLRNEIHYASGHRQDVLTYELQEQASKDFGFEAGRGRMAVENFMRSYYLRARGIREVTQKILDKTFEKGPSRWSFLPMGKTRIDGRFFVMARSVCMEADLPGNKDIFQDNPETIFLAFRHSQSRQLPMSQHLKDAINDHIAVVGKKARESAACGRIFLEILGDLRNLYETLQQMHGFKILGRFLPEFGAVTAFVQHDMYHRYTVDEHSLLAVKKVQDLFNSEGLAYGEFRDALARVKDRQALMLAVLMHDTGKALGKGHSEQGARLAYNAAVRLGMEPERAEKVEFLVRNHLLMDQTSTRRELSDPKVIEKFCGIVDSRELLDMLFLMTYADVSAVGPDVFSDWKRMLLKELFEGAAVYMTDKSSVKERERLRRIGVSGKVVELITTRKLGTEAQAKKFLANMPPNYILSVPVQKAVKHFELTRNIGAGDVIIDYAHDRGGYTDLTIILHEVMGTLSIAAGGLAGWNMNILSAQIFTGKDGIVVDTLQVTDYNKQPAHDDQLWNSISEDLKRLLTGQARVEDMMPAGSPYSRRTSLRDIPAKVVVDNDASDRYTVIEVYAQDRLGLLHDITGELFRLGCYISSAKVNTGVDQIVDVFYVTDIFRMKIEDRDRIENIKAALLLSISPAVVQ
jgi:[protein-PII] uridylyltransferase